MSTNDLSALSEWLTKGSREGLVLRRVTVNPKSGKPFKRAQWVRPDEANVIDEKYMNDRVQKARNKWHRMVSIDAKIRMLEKENPNDRKLKKVREQIQDRLASARRDNRERAAQAKVLRDKLHPPKRKKGEVENKVEVQHKPIEGGFGEKVSSIEAHLISGHISSGSKLQTGGINESIIVKYANGKKGIFKPSSGERAININRYPRGTLYKREVAAYKVSKMMGFDFVPPTVIREYDGKIGSVQHWIEHAIKSYKRPLNKQEDQTSDVALFDILIGNADRHGGNYVWQGEKLIAIDHGYSFPVIGSNVMSEIFNVVATGDIPNRLLTKLQHLENNWNKVEKELGKLIEPKALLVMRSKVKSLLKIKKFERLNS